MNLPDSLRRAVRTFVQAWTGTFLSLWIGPAITGEIPDRDFLERVAVASTIAGVVALITFIHNWAEDNVPAVPSILKATPSAGAHPVTVDPPK